MLIHTISSACSLSLFLVLLPSEFSCVLLPLRFHSPWLKPVCIWSLRLLIILCSSLGFSWHVSPAVVSFVFALLYFMLWIYNSDDKGLLAFLFQVCLSSLQFGPLLLYFMTEAETHAECSSGSINTSTHLWVFTKSGLSVWMDIGGKVSPWEITFSWKERCSDTTSHTVTANDKRGIRLKSDLLHHPSLWQLTFSV